MAATNAAIPTTQIGHRTVLVYSTESPGFAVTPPARAIDVRSTEWAPSARGTGTIPTTQRRKVSAVGITVGEPESLVAMARRRATRQSPAVYR